MESPGPARGAFENLLYDLASSAPPPAPNSTADGVIEFTFAAGNRALLLRWSPDHAALLAVAKAAVRSGVTEIVLVGGPPEARGLFKQIAPWYRPSALFGYHLPEGGPLPDPVERERIRWQWAVAQHLVDPALFTQPSLLARYPDGEVWETERRP